jgi:fluoroacetyl-CoA thioesterase
MAEFRIGAAREESVVVSHDHAITFLGPEGPRVLSTPRMIGLMETTCRNLVLGMLEPGHDTVGTHVNVSHCAAAPMGKHVTFHAELTGVTKRRVRFSVVAKMGGTVIGEGTHERAVIDVRRFKERVEQAGLEGQAL